MKIPTLRCLFSAAVIAVLPATARAQVYPNGYVTSSAIATGESTTFVRDGDTPNGFAWSEATLWKPDGSYAVLGSVGENPYSQPVTADAGAGTYWIQFRLVDQLISFQDQWISFTATTPSNILIANAHLSSTAINSGEQITLYRDGTASAGIAWTEAVVWRPDGTANNLGNAGLGSTTYTPGIGGTFSIQFRLVDNNMNYVDQWLTFTVSGGLQVVPDGKWYVDSNNAVWYVTSNYRNFLTDPGTNGTEVFDFAAAWMRVGPDELWLFERVPYVGFRTGSHWLSLNTIDYFRSTAPENVNGAGLYTAYVYDHSGNFTLQWHGTLY